MFYCIGPIPHSYLMGWPRFSLLKLFDEQLPKICLMCTTNTVKFSGVHVSIHVLQKLPALSFFLPVPYEVTIQNLSGI